MNCLAIWPRFPDSYWSFRAALRGTPFKATITPLPLLTVAGAAPQDWRIRLWDENVEGPVGAGALRGAERVLVSGMLVQKRSIRRVLRLAARSGVPSILGGPCVTQQPDLFPEATDRVQGELEGLAPSFFEEVLEPARAPRIWRSAPSPDIGRAAVPRFDLARRGRYHSHSVQFSRGCPFNCEFCDIIEIYGRRPRTKSNEQMLAELDALYRTGFRGDLFFVDDNFVGNARAALRLLPELARWQRARRFPFLLSTEVSLNLAERPELLEAMVAAGFDSVFCGIETPDPAALARAQKRQNTARDLVASIRTIQKAGLSVKGGFIVGFDGEDPSIFERQRRFIQDAAIPMAMVGLLMALPATQLTRRLAREGRLLEGGGDEGDQFALPNFKTTMPLPALVDGYSRLLKSLYAPRAYFERVVAELLRRPHPPWPLTSPEWGLRTFFRTVIDLSRSFQGARALFSSAARLLLRRPSALPVFVGFAAQLRHLSRYTNEVVVPRLEGALEALKAEASAAQGDGAAAPARVPVGG